LLVRNQRPQQFRVRAAFLLSKKWALLRSFVREHPENQCGIEQTLAYRKKVGEEFERLAAISERTPLFKKTERIYSDAFELAGFAGNRLVQHYSGYKLNRKTDDGLGVYKRCRSAAEDWGRPQRLVGD
jgi:hypothetical protein